MGAGLVVVAGAVLGGWLTLEPQSPSAPVSPALPATDDAVIEAVHAALDAWAKFALTGDLDVLDGHFHPDGPQYEQLLSEAASVRQNADNRRAYRFEVQEATLRDLNRRDAATFMHATLKRDGEADRVYRWVIRLRLQPDHGWTVWTIATAEEEPARP